MGNNLSSSRRQPKRVSSPRKVKNPNRFSFGSRKKRALQQQQVAAASASPRKRFGFGSKKRAHHQPKVVATKPKRFGFGSKNKRAARQQHYETTSTPAAIQNIKAKISPSPAAPVGTSKRDRKRADKNNATSFAKRFAPLALAKAKSKKQQRHAPPPTAKRGLFSGFTSRNRRRY